jgi:hypothetical protein
MTYHHARAFTKKDKKTAPVNLLNNSSNAGQQLTKQLKTKTIQFNGCGTSPGNLVLHICILTKAKHPQICLRQQIQSSTCQLSEAKATW